MASSLPKLMSRPAAKVIRDEGVKLLKKTDKAVKRLADKDDSQALHDSRVALRRLRGWFQAFRKELPLKHKHRRKLRELAHSTNEARDAEVSLEWLGQLKPPPARVDAVAGFCRDLERQRAESYRRVRKGLPDSWEKLRRKLEQATSDVRASHHPFQRSLTASLRHYGKDFEKALAVARRKPEPKQLHAARIAGKKLRYLVDAVLPEAHFAKRFMGEMRDLHDSAGEIQDLQRLMALAEENVLRRTRKRYRHLLKLAGAPRSGAESGLEPFVWLGQTAAQEQARDILTFRKTYLGKRPACVRELHGMIRYLESHAA